ncbi:MAG: hypothetical protein KGV44_05940 [Flavobacteriaceae bacterium]|nr:hypothetical protein [Flavobacteriaceae bacterium]
MENNNQLVNFENTKIVDIISRMPNLTDADKLELIKKVASDDVEVRKQAMQQMTQSQIAQHDLMTVMGELNVLNKKGMYIKSKQTVKTGTGQFEIEVKGGDKNIIIPFLAIVAIIAIVIVVLVMF